MICLTQMCRTPREILPVGFTEGTDRSATARAVAVSASAERSLSPGSKSRVLPQPTVPFTVPSRDAAIAGAIARFPGEQWGWWDLGSDLKARLRSVLEARFDELFAVGAEGFVPRYVAPGREILITWQPQTEDL